MLSYDSCCILWSIQNWMLHNGECNCYTNGPCCNSWCLGAVWYIAPILLILNFTPALQWWMALHLMEHFIDFVCEFWAKFFLYFSSCRWKPCVTLTDILKTDQGKAHLGRIKQRCNLGKQAQVSDLPKGCGKNKDEPSVWRDKTASVKSANKDTNKNTTPQRNKKTPTLSSRR